MLESLVRGNPHARFGGGHTEKYRQIAATRRVPTLPKTVTDLTQALIAAANKQLARCQKGSANWCKAKKKLARLHYRIACNRDDLLHKLTTEIATTAGVVGIESLHVKGLIQNRRLSLSFSDTALGKLLRLLECKVTHRGGQVVKVDRFFPSSQLCH